MTNCHLGLLMAIAGGSASMSVSALAQPGGSGDFPAIMESDPGLATHTVYRPESMSAFDDARKLPIVAWGNGGCANAGDSSKNFLTEIASHGMLVIAVGPIQGDRPIAAAGEAPNGPPRSAPGTTSAQLTEAIDWALAENQRVMSRYAGRLNPEAVAVMGYSCGGLQALSRSLDPRIKTTVLWNSGVLPEGDRRPGMDASKQILTQLTAPIAYISGGPTDIAYPNSVDDVSRIDGVPVFFANLDVGHGGTYREVNGGAYGAVAADWLKWQLLDDAEASKTFVGATCGLCTDPAWTVDRFIGE